MSERCDCETTVNGMLAAHNARLVTTLGFGGTPCRAVLRTEKLDSKKRGAPPPLLASCCPFCGVRYVPTTQPGAQQ